eukprot:SAG22_NODE_1681_length_3818_cov_1.844313_1_plen_289_part_00
MQVRRRLCLASAVHERLAEENDDVLSILDHDLVGRVASALPPVRHPVTVGEKSEACWVLSNLSSGGSMPQIIAMITGLTIRDDDDRSGWVRRDDAGSHVPAWRAHFDDDAFVGRDSTRFLAALTKLMSGEPNDGAQKAAKDADAEDGSDADSDVDGQKIKYATPLCELVGNMCGSNDVFFGRPDWEDDEGFGSDDEAQAMRDRQNGWFAGYYLFATPEAANAALEPLLSAYKARASLERGSHGYCTEIDSQFDELMERRSVQLRDMFQDLLGDYEANDSDDDGGGFSF